jgi:hypothetical protein
MPEDGEMRIGWTDETPRIEIWVNGQWWALSSDAPPLEPEIPEVFVDAFREDVSAGD